MKELTKAQQIFLYVAPFPALLFYKIWGFTGPGPENFLIVTVAMFVYCIGAIGIAYWWDKPGYFDWAFCGYFGVASALVALSPERASGFLARYTATGIYASLFSAAFFPPLLGFAPFTVHYAKKSTPKEHWENPIFLRVNRIMTYVWAGMFAVCIGMSLYPSLITRALLPVALIVGFGVPFTIRFPDFYLKRIGLPSLAEQRKMACEAAAEREHPPAGDLPVTAWQAVSGMPSAFNPERAGDLSAVMGFTVSGAETFEAYIQIEGGTCTFHEEAPKEPDLLIRTPAEVWLAISRGEREGQEAFMAGAFSAEGDLGILMRMGQVFSGRKGRPAEGAEAQEKSGSPSSDQDPSSQNGVIDNPTK